MIYYRQSQQYINNMYHVGMKYADRVLLFFLVCKNGRAYRRPALSLSIMSIVVYHRLYSIVALLLYPKSVP